MKNLGKIIDPKDIITKEYVDEGIGKTVNTLEDNLAMAESDIESLQGDVNTLKTDNTATKTAVKTLQDTYVPNTRTVNNKALDENIALTASDVGALPSNTVIPTKTSDLTNDSGYITQGQLHSDVFVVTITRTSTETSADKTFDEIQAAYNADQVIICYYAQKVLNLSNIDTTGQTLFFTSPTSSPSIYTVTYRNNTWSVGNSDLLTPNRKINGYALRQDITLSASDVGALPSTTVIPTATSDLTNDSNFVSATDLASSETSSAINADTLGNHASSYFATASSVTDLTTLVNTINTFINTLATVATTGSYTDLTNQPTIPTIYSGTTDPSASLGKNGDIYIKYSS